MIKKTTGLALVPLAALLMAPALSGAGLDYAECSYSSQAGVLDVSVNDEEGMLRRRGDEIVVRIPTGQASPRYESVTCAGGQATVDNTDQITFTLVGEIGATEGRISLGGGPFAPGATPEEDDSPEIELVASARSEDDELRIEGTGGADRLRGGRTEGSAAINLNPDADGADPDPDLTLAQTGQATVGFRTGAGKDVVELNGGPEFSGPLRARWLIARLGDGADRYLGPSRPSFVWAGKGADRVVTGDRPDMVFDEQGDDQVTTRGSGDFILGGPGRDRVSSGGGADRIIVVDGERDRIDCGGGRDKVTADRKDVTVGCERVA